MSTYRKEKNIIIISLNGTSGDYRLDINTGVFYGIKGNPVKTCPRRSEIRSLFPYYRSDNGNNLEYVLNNMFNYCTSPSLFAGYVEALQAADKLDALNIENLRLRNEWYVFLGQHIKELVAYLNENEWRDFPHFKRWVAFEKIRKDLGSAGDLLTSEMYWRLTDNIAGITTEELGVCAYYLGRGKYWEYHDGNVSTLTEYILLCRTMEKTPQKVNNFMREYCETKKTYELRKTEFDNKRIAMNYATHSKAWDFQFGDYIVVIPTCGQDIVTEGERMHHCVGSYVNRVVNNECYICFIRHKDTPDTPYITCQVYKNGNIGQYFLAYDHYISSEKDRAFKSAFEVYLAEVWTTN
jgi:hypothetical protein